jgi:hypothetical protein
MTLFDTIDYYLQQTAGDMESLSWEIREESNYEDHDTTWLEEEYDINKENHENLLLIKSELARLQRYDEELSSVMPEDYKDWWQNSKEEWPLLAKLSIEHARESEQHAWEELAGEDL